MKSIIALLFLCIITKVGAQKSITAYPTTTSIKIDGAVTEGDWQSHLQEGNFIQTTPDNGKESVRKSDIGVLYDASYLYIAAVFYIEDKSEVNSQLTARDELGNTDFFGLQIDPFGQAREGYDFTVTAAGVQSDEKLSDRNGYGSFNVVWESDVTIYDDRWVVELKIPFNSIRFPKENLSNFKINFQRFSNSLNEESFWNPIRQDVDGYLNQFGKLEGLTNIDPPLNLSLLPFTSVVYEQAPDGNGSTNFNAGLDLKYVYDNAYTLDMSLIPDFSQAQSDDQVFNLSPFEVRFNENRQFFIEGTELFDKGRYLFTRRIGGVPIGINSVNPNEDEELLSNPITSNILNLVKFTGKSDNGLSIGVLNGVTASAKAKVRNTVTGAVREVETNPLTNYNAIVLDQQLRNNSSITLLNHSVLRNGESYDANFTALLGQWYDKNRMFSGRFRAALSQQYGLEDGTVIGQQYFGYLSKVSGRLTGGISVNLTDDTFDNNDFGFLRRNNFLTYRGNIAYTNPEPKKTFSFVQTNLSHRRRYYFSLNQLEQSLYKLQTFVTVKKSNANVFVAFTYAEDGRNFFESRTPDRAFNLPGFTETVLEYQTNRNKAVSWSGYGVFVDYIDDAIYTQEYVAGHGVRARFGQHLFLELEQDFSYNPNNAGFITQAEDDIVFGKRSVQQLTNRLSINYALNAKFNMNLRFRHYWIQVDYDKQLSLSDAGNLAMNDLDLNPDDFDTNFNTFNIDLVARWQFAPASEVSLGYKLGSTFFSDAVGSGYFGNLKNTVQTDGAHTLSLKMTYFLDWNRLRKKV